jgi:hypothetical protein
MLAGFWRLSREEGCVRGRVAAAKLPLHRRLNQVLLLKPLQPLKVQARFSAPVTVLLLNRFLWNLETLYLLVLV